MGLYDASSEAQPARIISSNMIRLAPKQDHQKDRTPIATAMRLRWYWRSGRRSGKRLCGFRLAAILRDVCSPDRAQRNPGSASRIAQSSPDYAALHPGYKSLEDGREAS